MREWMLGNKYGSGNKGKKFTEEHKRKISEAHKGKKHYWSLRGIKFSEEHKKKLSESRKGKHYPKLSERKKGSGNSMYGKRGELSPQWKGGKSFEPYTTDWTETLRRSIRERDNYTCQLCGKLQGDRAHSVHHIDYNKKNCDPNNLRTLCRGCNTKVNFNRNYWTNFLQAQMAQQTQGQV